MHVTVSPTPPTPPPRAELIAARDRYLARTDAQAKRVRDAERALARANAAMERAEATHVAALQECADAVAAKDRLAQIIDGLTKQIEKGN